MVSISMMEFLTYDFMIYALVIGILTAITTSILGNFMIVARQAMMSDMLSHAAIAGVGLGIFWDLSPLLGAFSTSIIVTLFLYWQSQKKEQAPEAIAVVLLNGSLAIALLLVHIDKTNSVSLESYLFGSILTISTNEFTFFIIVNLLIITILLLYWRDFLTLVFDKDFLYSRKKSHRLYEIIFMLLIASIVGIGLKVVGGLLIGAMTIIPALTVQHYCHNFQSNVIVSIVLNISAVCTGIISSFYFDIPTSSAIVLTHILFFTLVKTDQLIRR